MSDETEMTASGRGNVVLPPAASHAVLVMALGAQLDDLATAHAEWSRRTFGEDHEKGPTGALRHLQDEARETIEAYEELKRLINIEAPVAHTDRLRKEQAKKVATEFADCLLLWLDGTRRAGLTPLDVILAAHAKLAVLKTRTYLKTPDGVPSMHVRPGRGGKSTTLLEWFLDLPLWIQTACITTTVIAIALAIAITLSVVFP